MHDEDNLFADELAARERLLFLIDRAIRNRETREQLGLRLSTLATPETLREIEVRHLLRECGAVFGMG